MSRITIFGQGAMGARMADRLEAAGHQVTRWNRTGSGIGPREAAAGAEFAIAVVRDDEAAKRVWLHPEDGALGGLHSGALAIESSTLSLGFTRDLHARFGQAGRTLIDAPVVGSRPQAEAGQLIHLIGGTAEDFTRAEPILAALGQRIIHAGPPGSGMLMKLVVNALFGVQVAAVAELIGLIDAARSDGAATMKALADSPVCSPVAADAIRSMAAGDFRPLFPTELAGKDLRYAMLAAREAGAHTPVLASTLGAFEDAIAAGFGEDHLTGLVRLYRTSDTTTSDEAAVEDMRRSQKVS